MLCRGRFRPLTYPHMRLIRLFSGRGSADWVYGSAWPVATR